MDGVWKMARVKIINRLTNNSKLPDEHISTVNKAIDYFLANFGEKWFDSKFPDNQYTRADIPSLLSYYKCLMVCDQIRNGDRLLKKLIHDPVNWDQNSIAEAEVAQKLINTGCEVTYEKDSNTIRPDFCVECADDNEVYFEVSRLSLSYEDKIQWHGAQTELSNKVAGLLHGGAVDIYINHRTINKNDEELILKAVKGISNSRNNDFFEELLNSEILVVYDKTGSVRADRANPPPFCESGLHDVCIVDPENDRSVLYKEQYFPDSIMPCVSRVEAYTEKPGINKANIVRVYRLAYDDRFFGKLMNKSAQLFPDKPGIIVLDITESTAQPEDWSQSASRLFYSGIYRTISAVWIRTGIYSDFNTVWKEIITLNPTSNFQIDARFFEQIIGS